MEFKIGDKVRVREDLKVGDGFGCTTAIEDMLKYRGKIMTIKEARSSVVGNYTIYEIDDDGEFWAWTDEMLEPVYADGGYVPYHKIPTPSKPVPIEEQLGLPKGVSIHDLPTSEWYNPMRLTFKNGSSIEAIPNEDAIRSKEPELVWIDKIALPTATETKEMVERIRREIFKFTNAFPKEEKKLKFTFYVKEGTRPDKKCNGVIPTMTTNIELFDGNVFDKVTTIRGSATCDKVDYDERQGVLEALANAVCGGEFEKRYSKAVKANKDADLIMRTCTYCGKVCDTSEEKIEHEKWHVERKKARRERYLLRKRAKEIAFEEQAQKMAKEMIEK
jgi:hypothetical protein